MKKLVLFTLIVAMVAGATFAQLADGLSIGVWGRGAFAPLIIASDRKDGNGDAIKNSGGTYAGTGVTWGDGVWNEIYLTGETDYVGFGVGFYADADAGIGSLNPPGAHVWAQPFGSDVFKVRAGTFTDDTLRGKIGSIDGGFEYFTVGGLWEEDAIFHGFGRGAGYIGNSGYMLSSVPAEGLFIGWYLGTEGHLWDFGAKASSVYRFMQLGFGYEIADVGLARLQYVGGYLGKDDGKNLQKAIDDEKTNAYNTDYVKDLNKPARIEAAFAFTGMEDLLIDFGLKLWFPVTLDGKYTPKGGSEITFGNGRTASNGVDVALGASFGGGDFGLTARVDANFGSYSRSDKDDKSADGMYLDFGIIPSFNLGFGTLGLDIGLKTTGNSKDYAGDEVKDGSTQFGFGAWISKDLGGNGYIKAGLSYTLPETPADKDNKARGSGVFRIPVVLEYWF